MAQSSVEKMGDRKKSPKLPRKPGNEYEKIRGCGWAEERRREYGEEGEEIKWRRRRREEKKGGSARTRTKRMDGEFWLG